MSLRRAALTIAFALAACAPSAKRPSSASVSPASRETTLPRARLFQSAADEAFWVAHRADEDLLVAGGARVVASPSGEVKESAWDVDLWKSGDAIAGSLEVAPNLGGGFVHWSRSRLFRSKEFTGPLEPIDTSVFGPNNYGIRGARNGLEGVIVLAEQGVRVLLPGASELTPPRDPGIVDALALDATRAVKIDVFGRTFGTVDGGKSWKDLAPYVGASVRSISSSPTELWVEAMNSRYTLAFDGAGVRVLDPPTPGYGYRYDRFGGLQVQWKGTRATATEDTYYYGGYPGQSALIAAIDGGAPLGDGTALALYQGKVVRVDLATGEELSAAADWIPSNLGCALEKVDDGVLFACSWSRYGSYGGYVLRSDGRSAPVMEKIFADAGFFVGDYDGAFAFTGSCTSNAQPFDPNDQWQYRGDFEQRAPDIKPVVCVRRGPGDWVEHSIEVDKDASMLAWVPKKDGGAVALELVNDALPRPSPALASVGTTPPSRDEGGARVVRVANDVRGWYWTRLNAYTYGRGYGGQSASIDRRFRARDDGSIDGWMSQTDERYGYSAFSLGATIQPDGATVPYELAPDVSSLSYDGDYGLAVGASGDLFLTTTHGRSWRFAGRASLPPSMYSASCSSIGCSFSSFARVGWGDEPAVGRISKGASTAEKQPKLPRLACAPRGEPEPLQQPVPPQASPQRSNVATSFGQTIEIVRDSTLPDINTQASPYAYPSPQPAPPPPPTTTASGKKKAPAAPVLRTHTLIFRPPLEPAAKVATLNATDAGLAMQRRLSATPLLGLKNEVDLLVYADTNELLVTGDKVDVLPLFDGSRYSRGGDGQLPGLATAAGRAFVLSESRSRLSLEEHGAKHPPQPVTIGADRNILRRKLLTLGRRDDGATAVMILDGATPPSVSAAVFDRASATTGDIVALAPWSTLTAADDPRCKKLANGVRALFIVDPNNILRLDAASLPGVTLGHQALALVHWGTDRACLEGLDASVVDQRGRAGDNRSLNVVVRFDRPKAEAAALRSNGYREDLTCSLEPAETSR